MSAHLVLCVGGGIGRVTSEPQLTAWCYDVLEELWRCMQSDMCPLTLQLQWVNPWRHIQCYASAVSFEKRRSVMMKLIRTVAVYVSYLC